MFLRSLKRIKDGKTHYYWSVVENRRLLDGRVAQPHVLYLGELNGRQESSWRRTVEPFGQDEEAPQQVALFPEDHAPVQADDHDWAIVRIRLSEMSLRRPQVCGWRPQVCTWRKQVCGRRKQACGRGRQGCG